YLDEAGVPSTFYDLPSNYPPSPSKCGHHRCLCGMGTPDVRGTYGTYHYFSEDGPIKERREQGGTRYKLTFDNDTARVKLIGPEHGMLKSPKPVEVELSIHRDRQANAGVLQLSKQRVVLKSGQWSRWVRLDFEMGMPWFLPNKTV